MRSVDISKFVKCKNPCTDAFFGGSIFLINYRRLSLTIWMFWAEHNKYRRSQTGVTIVYSASRCWRVLTKQKQILWRHSPRKGGRQAEKKKPSESECFFARSAVVPFLRKRSGNGANIKPLHEIVKGFMCSEVCCDVFTIDKRDICD